MGSRILIVEDNPANLKMMRVLMEGGGHEVRTAVCALEAIAAIPEFGPRLILMDVQLPGMDGLTLTRLLRRQPAYQNLVIVAVSAFAMAGDVAKAISAGCDAYITKPIDTRTFVKRVESYLHLRSIPALG